VVAERVQRPDEVERTLDRGEAAGPADDERLVGGTDLRANRAPGLLVGLAPLR
jgi:hypothetical protein